MHERFGSKTRRMKMSEYNPYQCMENDIALKCVSTPCASFSFLGTDTGNMNFACIFACCAFSFCVPRVWREGRWRSKNHTPSFDWLSVKTQPCNSDCPSRTRVPWWGSYLQCMPRQALFLTTFFVCRQWFDWSHQPYSSNAIIGRRRSP